ncbi:MAG: translation initiation factor IF-2, partial [Minisyncoccales bacterium]
MEERIKKQPIVVVVGHVDSGKTTLLDFIKKTNIAQKEKGQITQKIDFGEIEFEGKKITFLDTPGHEAFLKIRERGSRVADLALLVVDATKGVQEQTRESIKIIKKLEIPLIVAINKIDRIDAQIEKTERELEKEEIILEKFGGKIPSVLISAKSGQGINELLELISLMVEMENLKVDLSKMAGGVVLESYFDRRKGNLVLLALLEGTLKKGDFIATPSSFGKIKKIIAYGNKEKERIFPGEVFLVLGLEKTALAGERFFQFEDENKAQEFFKEEKEKKEIFEKKEIDKEKKLLNIILKADCLGSLEAVELLLNSLSSEEMKINIVKKEIGDFKENDIKEAKEKKAILLGFKVSLTPSAKIILKNEKIKFLNFEIIYELQEEIKKLMKRMIEPKFFRLETGRGKVLIVFLSKGKRQVVGVKILEGEVQKGSFLEIWRQEKKIGEGKIINLQKEKKDIEKAIKGENVGILYQGEIKIEEEDQLVFFKE